MGQFELFVMSAILRQGNQAYGRRLHADLQDSLGKSVPSGQVYVALARLEHKGYLESWIGDPTPVRGGRSKRFYRLTAVGKRTFRAEAARWQKAATVAAIA